MSVHPPDLEKHAALPDMPVFPFFEEGDGAILHHTVARFSETLGLYSQHTNNR
jgi:hypothetical protein